MVYKSLKIKKSTDELLNNCIEEFLKHHKEMRNMKISRDKIIFETAKFYLEN